MKFKELRETMVTVADWESTWDRDMYIFKHENDHIEVLFQEEDKLQDYSGNSAWEISFEVNGTMWPQYKKESTISPYVLFSTVLDIIKDHQRKTNNEIYIYHPSSKSLERIYNKLIKRFLPRGWGISSWKSPGEYDYVVLYKKANS